MLDSFLNPHYQVYQVIVEFSVTDIRETFTKDGVDVTSFTYTNCRNIYCNLTQGIAMKLEDSLKDEKFVEFLKKHKVYELYTKYFDIVFASCYTVTIRQLMINHAFEWNRTIEGHDFWRTLHNKWVDECKSKLQKYLEGIDTVSQT